MWYSFQALSEKKQKATVNFFLQAASFQENGHHTLVSQAQTVVLYDVLVR